MIQARYTEVLYNLLKNERVKQAIDEAMSEYPMYIPENPTTYSLIPTREELNKRILDHYKYREIAFETVGRFIDELRISLNEIMPYYYQMYKSEDVMNGIDDIFGNVDIIEQYTETSTGTATGSSNANSTATSNTSMEDNSKTISSDTPQSSLNIGNIDDVSYANNVTWNKNTSESEGTDTATNTASSTNSSEGTTEHTLTKKGNQGVNTYAHDMGQLRDIFMNITEDIINNSRIQELFMMIY